MEYTANAKMKKPGYSDTVDVQDLNENFDAIDNHLGQSAASDHGAHGMRFNSQDEVLEVYSESTGTWEGILTAGAVLSDRGPRRTDIGTPGQRWIDTAHGNIEYTCMSCDGDSAVWSYTGGINKNILDNSYLANPVNQRKFTAVAGKSTLYTLLCDRWAAYFGGEGLVSLTSEGLQLVSNDLNAVQVLENVEANRFRVGQTYTISVLFSDNTNLVVTVQFDRYFSVVNSIENTLLMFRWLEVEASFPQIVIQVAQGTKTIVSAMVEPGETQHHFYQDMDGNWVLNSIPDYGQELAKCQRYQVAITPSVELSAMCLNKFESRVVIDYKPYEYDHGIYRIPIPSTLRAKPVLTNMNNYEIIYNASNSYNGNALSHISEISWSVYDFGDGWVELEVKVLGTVSFENTTLRIKPQGIPVLILDANL